MYFEPKKLPTMEDLVSNYDSWRVEIPQNVSSLSKSKQKKYKYQYNLKWKKD